MILPLVVACGGEKGAAAAAPPAAPAAAPGAIFERKGCQQCHSISAFGIKSATDVGPDLTNAYADVQTRFGVKLEEFFVSPTGTMQMVLSSMIKLTPAERDSIIHILKELDEERQERDEHNERQERKEGKHP
ncbi:MAG TPA: hypothetical protein VJ755_03405 [Gemmatimonadales bacterium]|nr:hypothetical protein [Gemmatimonadales bacterium]